MGLFDIIEAMRIWDYGCEKMKKKGIILGLIFLIGCTAPQEENTEITYSRTEILMNTPVEIQIFNNGSNELLDDAFDLVADLERRLTVNDTGSEVEDINEAAGISPIAVSEDTFYLIERSVYFSSYSDGLFNVAIGPLTQLWSIGFDNAQRPDDDEIADILPLLNYLNITLDPNSQTVFLEEKGMRLDLGGIAKGFIADEVSSLLTDHDVDRALIIVGGDIFALGHNDTGDPWRIGIRNPILDPNSEQVLIGSIPAANQAVATSGVYERYIEVAGNIYHHTLDWQTGFPFETDILSISIVADTGLLAEVYSTVLFGKTIEEGLAYIESIDSIEAILISADKGIYLTTGLQENFVLLAEDFEIR